MSLVLSSIVIFIILAPGIVFRLGYLSSEFSRKISDRNIIDDITWSIIPGLVLQLSAIILINNFSEYVIHVTYVGFLLIPQSDETAKVFQNIQLTLPYILLYHIVLNTCSFLLGHCVRLIIRRFKLDRKYLLFRFSNKWHYILSGECLDFPHVPDEYEEISVKIVDVLCQVGDKKIIYIGELFDYHLDNKGDLEMIHLRYPTRRDFLSDNKDEGRYYEIPSRFIVIPYKTILNINIRYFSLSPQNIEE